MRKFRLANPHQSSILDFYSEREHIQLDPPYQRLGEIWTLEKKQLLIDSILNGFDVPKIYFHEFNSSKVIDGKRYDYAIIDGKQRLAAIWEFIDGDYALADDFKYMEDETRDMHGLNYNELAKKYPLIKTRFDAWSLPIVTIKTDDTELIEDMFSRLNEAVPLNAAEKRNAFGGPMPSAIRELTKEPFFARNLPFPNSRYRHYDLAAKFLYLEYSEDLVDLKKIRLDLFVKNFRGKKPEEAQTLVEACKRITEQMTVVFVGSDTLLRSVGNDVLYYWLFRTATIENWSEELTCQSFNKLEQVRKENRDMAEVDLAAANYDLMEYDRLVQSPNDSLALKFRYKILSDFMRQLS